jgi:hypothetical protein
MGRISMSVDKIVPETQMSVSEARLTLESHSWAAWGQGGPNPYDVMLARATIALADLRERFGVEASTVDDGRQIVGSALDGVSPLSFPGELARIARKLSSSDLVHEAGSLAISPTGADRVIIFGHVTLKQAGA